MIYKISNKGRTPVQCQLIGGEAVNIKSGNICEIDSGKVFRRELDRLDRIPGVRVSELDKAAEAVAKKKAEEDAKKAAEKKKEDDAAAKKKKDDDEAAAKKAADDAKKAGGNK